MKKRFIIISGFVILLPLLALAQAADPAFNPNKLIADKTFSDIQTFGEAQGIQKFLVSKNSVLANTGADFLLKLKEPNITMLKQGLDDPEPNLGRLRTAAELIWDASVSSGLNPQVILVTLNKEQGLITSKSPDDPDLQRALDHAMGFDCPDGAGCGNLFPGFYYQLFGNFDSAGNRYLGAAKSLMKSFNTASGRGPQVNGESAHVGDVITLDNTLGGFDNVPPQQSITLGNLATAALYRYTPHVFNGNYNFWRYFQAWFKYPNGTLLKLLSSQDVYIIQNGLKALVPQFVAKSRGLDLTNPTVISPTEFDGYDTDKPLGPVDNTVVQVAGDGNKYVFLDNVRHLASDLVISQRGLDKNQVLAVSSQEASVFELGPVLPPKDGTVIRGATDQAVYLVQGGKIKMYSAYTFAQQKIKTKNIYYVPDAEISTYTKDGFVPPLDGSLVKGKTNDAVFLAENGLKEPVLAEIFKNRGFSLKQIATISDDEIWAMPIGAYAAPKDQTYFSTGSKSGPLYVFKEGSKHGISPFVAKQRGITPDYVFDPAVALEWFDGIPIPPSNNTVVKGNGDQTVFLVVNSQLRPLTYQAFKNRRISAKRIATLPQAEIDAYAKGDVMQK